MFHESVIARTASSEVSQLNNVEKIDLKSQLENVICNLEVVNRPIPYTLESVIIANDDGKYYVDFESFVNYINVSESTAYDGWKKIEEHYDISADDMYLVLPCKEKFNDAINEVDCSTAIAKHKCMNSIAKMVIMIENLQNDGINLVISEY